MEHYLKRGWRTLWRRRCGCGRRWPCQWQHVNRIPDGDVVPFPATNGRIKDGPWPDLDRRNDTNGRYWRA